MISFCLKWIHEGIWAPGPPCLELPYCNRVINTNGFCHVMGILGSEKYGENYRSQLMYANCIISFIMLIFVVLCIATLDTNEDNIERFYWSFGEGNHNNQEYQVFGSVSHLAVKFPGFHNSTLKMIDWSKDECVTGQAPNGQNFGESCNNCKDASLPLRALVLGALITEFPAISTHITRSTKREDSNCQKFMGVLTTIGSGIMQILALRYYSQYCNKYLPDKVLLPNGDYVNLDYYLGAPFVFMLMATLLKIPAIIIHAIVPVPPESRLTGIAKGYLPPGYPYPINDTPYEEKDGRNSDTKVIPMNTDDTVSVDPVVASKFSSSIQSSVTRKKSEGEVELEVEGGEVELGVEGEVELVDVQ